MDDKPKVEELQEKGLWMFVYWSDGYSVLLEACSADPETTAICVWLQASKRRGRLILLKYFACK